MEILELPSVVVNNCVVEVGHCVRSCNEYSGVVLVTGICLGFALAVIALKVGAWYRGRKQNS